jgi:heme exporter protein CcmD
MPDLGEYAFNVLASYGATSLVILIVIIWFYMKYDRARKTLSRVERKVNEK